MVPLQVLHAMYSSWEEEIINAAFESNGYDVERTIEDILAMNQFECGSPTRYNEQR
jgi:hypothetical protein